MGDLKYIDFDVAIEPAGREFTARVFNSPVGQAASTFSAPFSDTIAPVRRASRIDPVVALKVE